MPLYRRPHSKNWYVRFEIGGQEVRRSAGTDDKEAAEEFENHLRGLAWREIKLGEKRRTFDEAAIRWLDEREDKRALHSDESIIKWFREHLEGTLLTEIDGDEIARLRALKRKQASQATVNRHMAWLRAMLRAARDQWGWIDKIPKIQMYTLERPEPRWITPSEFERLAKKLPPYLEPLARFAVLTGLRRTALITLAWSQVDLKRKHVWIAALRSKSKKAIAVPLGADAVRVLKSLQGDHEDFVFTYEGGPCPAQNGYFWKQWRLAVKAAKIEPFRFHDLRHTWASWHIQNGTPPHILQELGGWSSYEMVKVYAHLNADHLSKWAGNMKKKRV